MKRSDEKMLNSMVAKGWTAAIPVRAMILIQCRRRNGAEVDLGTCACCEYFSAYVPYIYSYYPNTAGYVCCNYPPETEGSADDDNK